MLDGAGGQNSTGPAIDAVNLQPVAVADAFQLEPSSGLVVASPGLLGNDEPQNESVLSTHLLTSPRFGTLSFPGDGGFQFTPFPGFEGTDSFRYQFETQYGLSNPVMVSLQVPAEPLANYDAAAKPNVIVVNSVLDSSGSSNGLISLRSAIAMAEANGPSMDIIEIPDFGYSIQISASLGPLQISSDIEIRGAFDGQRIEANGNTNLIEVDPGVSVTLENLELTGGDLTTGNGGAIWNAGDLTIRNSFLHSNEVETGKGGAIFNATGSSLLLQSSTISGNEAYLDGGGVFNADGATLHVNSSTISSNVSGLWGGGIYSPGASTIQSSTVVLNEASTGSNLAVISPAQLADSIFALGIQSQDVEGTIVSLGGNLVGKADSNIGYLTSDQVGTLATPIDPNVGSLQFNGGVTPTHMLLPGSPAIDAGVATHHFSDQRGADRVSDGLEINALADDIRTVDIGAVEFGAFFLNTTIDAVDATPLGDGRVDVDLNTPGDQVSLRGAIQEFNALAGVGTASNLNGGTFEATVFSDLLDSQTYELRISGVDEEDAATGDLDVYGNLAIRGGVNSETIGGKLRIDGGWPGGENPYNMPALLDRHFHVHAGATLNLDAVQLFHGQTDHLGGIGGAILNDGGTLVVSDTIVRRNVSQQGGGISTLLGTTIIDGGSEVYDNYSTLGGGIYLDGGSLYVDQSTIRDNYSVHGGGGFYIRDGQVNIANRSIIKNNSHYDDYYFYDQQGSAIFIAAGKVTVSGDSELRRNGMFYIASNYEVPDVNDPELLPNPAHHASSSASYVPNASVFVAESAEFNLLDSMVYDHTVDIVSNLTIGVVNLGRFYSRDVIYTDNKLILANFNSGTALIEGGEITDSGGFYPLFREAPGVSMEYATSSFNQALVQNHNGELTLLDVRFHGNDADIFAHEISNQGLQSQMNIIGSTIVGQGLINFDGNVHIQDSLFADSYHQWYDNEPYALIEHYGQEPRLADVPTENIFLTSALTESGSTASVNDVSLLANYSMPMNITIGGERLAIDSIDFASNEVTLLRTEPLSHSANETLILRNSKATQIRFDDLTNLEPYDLPLDVYLATSVVPFPSDPNRDGARGGIGAARPGNQVEAMTVTDIDFSKGIVTVVRGRQGTTPIDFHEGTATLRGIAGQMKITGSTFTNNRNRANSGEISGDSSQTIVRSSVVELAPPLIIENTTFANNSSTGPVASVFAERNSLIPGVAPYYGRTDDLVIVDGGVLQRSANPTAVSLPPLLVENSVFQSSTNLNDLHTSSNLYSGLAIADIGELPDSVKHQNYIEAVSLGQLNVHHEYGRNIALPRDIDSDHVIDPFQVIDSELQSGVPGDQRTVIVMDLDALEPHLPISGSDSSGFLGDAWTLQPDPALTEQPSAHWSYSGLPDGEYSIAAMVRDNAQGTIGFDIDGTIGSRAVDMSLAERDHLTNQRWITLTDNYEYVAAGGAIEITIWPDGTNPIVADAIRIVERTDLQTFSPDPPEDPEPTEPLPNSELRSSDFFPLLDSRAAYQPTNVSIAAETLTAKFEDLIPGDYQLMANWDGLNNSITVTDFANGGTVQLDDPLSSEGFDDSFLGEGWYEAGAVRVHWDSLSLEVHLPDSTVGFSPELRLLSLDSLVAEKFQAVPPLSFRVSRLATSQMRRIIDNEHPGFTTTGTPEAVDDGGFGDSQVSLAGGETAQFHFTGLVPGVYLVASSTTKSNVPFSIAEGTSVLSSGLIEFDQPGVGGLLSRQYTLRQIGPVPALGAPLGPGNEPSVLPGMPSLLTSGASQERSNNVFGESGYSQGIDSEDIEQPRQEWLVLDRIEITGSELMVELTGGQSVLADAIRIERFDDLQSPLEPLADLGGHAGAHAPQGTGPLVEQGNRKLFLGLEAKLTKPLAASFFDGLLYLDDSDQFIRGPSNLDVPYFPYEIQVGRETMLATGFSREHDALIVQRGHRGSLPTEHAVGEFTTQGFAGLTTRLYEPVVSGQATTIRVDKIVGLPNLNQSTTRRFDVRVGREEMVVTQISDSGDGTLVLEVTRGVHGTTASSTIPEGTQVRVLLDQKGSNRFYDFGGSAGRQLDLGAVELVEMHVNSLIDAIDLSPGDGYVNTTVNGQVSLRAAINEANAIGGSATILLPSGTHSLTLDDTNTEDEFHHDLDILSDIAIVGAGADQTTIDAAALDRIFEVHPGAKLTLRNLTLTGGVTNGDGGAILVNDGTLHLSEVYIEQSMASRGAAIAQHGQSVTDLDRSTLANNTATQSGGGVYVGSGELHLYQSTLSGNTADIGGAIFADVDSTVDIDSSTLVDNSALTRIGGVEALGWVTVSQSVIAENTHPLVDQSADVAGRFTSGGDNFIGENQFRETAVYDASRPSGGDQ
ncbi:choice-of-anchor Q domain-containing protein, partial [Rhodopirellula bahusiensis]